MFEMQLSLYDRALLLRSLKIATKLFSTQKLPEKENNPRDIRRPWYGSIESLG